MAGATDREALAIAEAVALGAGDALAFDEERGVGAETTGLQAPIKRDPTMTSEAERIFIPIESVMFVARASEERRVSRTMRVGLAR